MLNNIPLFLSLGVVGLSNLSLLLLIAIWRTAVYIAAQRRLKTLHIRATQKKILLHLLLCAAVLVDLPMYVSFILIQDYNYVTYSFHKFQPMFLLAAYSITINDWSSVLYSIQEIKRLPLVFRTGFLVFINGVFSLFCVLNFVLIIAVSDVDRYTDTLTYKISIVLQIVTALALTLFMLHAGLGLSRRLQGVSGMLANETQHQTPQAGTGIRPRSHTNSTSLAPAASSTASPGFGFKTALNRLIVVMTTCSICIFIQLTLMIINYAAGYAGEKNKSPGPPMFYWTFYAWLPLWGPILAMLHLSRSRVHKADDDYDTTSPRPVRGGVGKRRKGEHARGDGTEPLLLGEEGCREGVEEGEEEGGIKHHRRGGNRGSGHSHLSQHSHLSSQSIHSTASATSMVSAATSVYRPPDYPSSLFRQHADEEDLSLDEDGGDVASSCSDSMLYMLGGESDRERNSQSHRFSQHTDMTERTTSSGAALSHDYLLDDGRAAALRGLEERGSSEDDYQHQYQYHSGSADNNNDMSMDLGLGGRDSLPTSSLRSDDNELSSMIEQNAVQQTNLTNLNVT